MYISIAIYSLLFYSSRVRSNNSHPLLHPGGASPAGLRGGMHPKFQKQPPRNPPPGGCWRQNPEAMGLPPPKVKPPWGLGFLKTNLFVFCKLASLERGDASPPKGGVVPDFVPRPLPPPKGTPRVLCYTPRGPPGPHLRAGRAGVLPRPHLRAGGAKKGGVVPQGPGTGP